MPSRAIRAAPRACSRPSSHRSRSSARWRAVTCSPSDPRMRSSPSRRSACWVRRPAPGSVAHVVEPPPSVRNLFESREADGDRLRVHVDAAQPLVEGSRGLVVAQDPDDHVAQAQLAKAGDGGLDELATESAPLRAVEYVDGVELALIAGLARAFAAAGRESQNLTSVFGDVDLRRSLGDHPLPSLRIAGLAQRALA